MLFFYTSYDRYVCVNVQRQSETSDDVSQLPEKYLSGNAALHIMLALILHSLTVKGIVHTQKKK